MSSAWTLCPTSTLRFHLESLFRLVRLRSLLWLCVPAVSSGQDSHSSHTGFDHQPISSSSGNICRISSHSVLLLWGGTAAPPAFPLLCVFIFICARSDRNAGWVKAGPAPPPEPPPGSGVSSEQLFCSRPVRCFLVKGSYEHFPSGRLVQTVTNTVRDVA